MSDGLEVFNLVALASGVSSDSCWTLSASVLNPVVVAGSITVKWVEEYFMAASRTSVEHGGQYSQIQVETSRNELKGLIIHQSP